LQRAAAFVCMHRNMQMSNLVAANHGALPENVTKTSRSYCEVIHTSCIWRNVAI